MSHSTRTKSFVAVAGGLASIATLLISLMVAFPSSYSASGVHCMSDVFKIERLTASSAVLIISNCNVENAVWKQGLFSGSSILSGSGELLDESVGHIWVILLDCYGRAYLQYPPVRLSGSHWSMANIRLGREIAEIEFWGVDEAGHHALQRLADGMIKDRSWPPQALEDLPAHSVLGSVNLLYKRSFLSIF